MNISAWELAMAMGIPSAVTGLAVWGLKKILDKRDEKVQEQNKALIKILIAQVMCNNAALGLAEATANAVARIPDAHCNGDMHEALQIARNMKKQQSDLLAELSISSVVT